MAACEALESSPVRVGLEPGLQYVWAGWAER